ncbi:MAG TPA: carbohydrate-binding protein [Bacteroidales bacterium]|nr:carbohydrate-binding protein [Bacteroidales bacterium]HNS46721.1 carbohydrate-binding protein [Bacteroidales bacterium]
MNKLTSYGILIALLLSFIPTGSSAQGFLHAGGKYIYDGNGNAVILRGVGTGNWLLNEGYMMKTADFAGTHTQFRTKLTQTIGEQNTAIYYETWLDNHFTRRDVDSMKVWGFNSVRVAMHYKWLTLPIEEEPVAGQDTWLEDGFVRIDSLLAWCSDNEMYLILDLHGAPGGQGQDRNISDYDPDFPSLWESAENRRKTVALWQKLAERYAGEPWIGGYDLINEPNWDLPNGTLLRQTYVSITNAIREVDQDHMIIIEGNWFANDYTGLTPPWDDNMVCSFHKYWNYNTQESIQWMLTIRNTHQVPVWLGETGENSNSWFTDLIRLAEQNRIGWSMWPVKKAGINNVLMVPESNPYNNLISYWQTGMPPMTPEQAFYAVLDWADNHRIENCTVQRDVIDAMLRQPHSNSTIPFKTHTIENPVNVVDYDLGKCSYAYWDADTANYRLNTNVFTNWNEGWSYRNDGVDIERCFDTYPGGNGYDVGWTQDKEWMQYTILSDSAAAYQVLFRSASTYDPGIVHFEVNGTDVCQQHLLPLTGGWQAWASSIVEQVIIPAGENKLKFYFDKGGSNVSLFQFLNPVPVSAVPFEFISGKTNATGTAITLTLNKPVSSISNVDHGFVVLVNENQSEIDTMAIHPENLHQLVIQLQDKIRYGQTISVSYAGNSVISDEQLLQHFSNKPVFNDLPSRFILPALIQAEDFDVNVGFQLEDCSDIDGGQNIGYANNGDYLDYNITVPAAREYSFRFRVASLYSNGSISVRLGDGNTFTALKTIFFKGTGGWQSWTTQEYSMDLPAGDYTLRLYSLSGEYNINWFDINLLEGINDIPQLKHFRIFPNPNDGQFVVEAEFKENTPVTIAMYNFLGNQLLNYRIGKTISFSQRINYLGNKPGIYFLNVTTEMGQLTRKVVIR